jgi:uncharacterized protein YndB with AHSA1/START domain
MTSSVLVALRVKASPLYAFDVFTAQIGAWWRPDPLFQITSQGDGVLAFEGERLVARLPNGDVFEVGLVTEWRRGEKLAFTWRPAALDEKMTSRVEVTFEEVGNETRVSVRHFGWLEIPRKHALRHGFPDEITLKRAADWWRRSLATFEDQARRE